MKKIVSFAARAVFATMLLAASGMAAAATATAEPWVANMEPEAALQWLKDGNASYLAGNLDNLTTNSSTARRIEVAGGQHPNAIILDCADSRLSPEIIFDKGLGEIFVIRIAGNMLAPHQLGSIDYAVEHLHAGLIVILGHSKCGAVNATVGSLDANCIVQAPADNIGSLIDAISKPVEKVCRTEGLSSPTLLPHSIDENTHHVHHNLLKKSVIVAEKVHAGEVKIVDAVYDLESGTINWFGH